MAQSQKTMKQICSRNVSYQIELMEWSSKMDLIAIACKGKFQSSLYTTILSSYLFTVFIFLGDVIIHRFKWQKVWSHPAPEENVRVRAIAWRNDEKMLAIGYSNGLITLLDIENHEEIFSLQLSGDITCMSWTNSNHTEIVSDAYKEMNFKHSVYEEESELNSSKYLAPLPSLSSLSSTAKKHDYNSLKYYSKTVPNLLLIGYKPGVVKLLVFGVLPCGAVHIKLDLVDQGELIVRDVKMNDNLRELCVLVESENGVVHLLVYENNYLSKYSNSLLSLATQHGYILNTLTYITDTIQCITEAWEQVLKEMDNKLMKFAETMPPGESLAADFLELLIFGYPSSPELLSFLTKDLTEKGLKKLGNSIDLSYSTIQKLVVKPLTSGIINILYHLSTIKGMHRHQFYYGDLLDESCEEAFIAAGSFFIKAKELQQTIDTSTRDYKIFFRWLYYVLVRLQEENVPSDIASVSQQEINYLAEFIKNFDDINEKVQPSGLTTKRKFNLERVGQYLNDAELVFPGTIDVSKSWHSFIKENHCLALNPNILPHHQNLSLIQEFNELKKNIGSAFSRPEEVMSREFKLRSTFKTTVSPQRLISTPVSQLVIDNKHERVPATVSAIIDSDTSIVFIETRPQLPIRAVKLILDHSTIFGTLPNLTFRHLQFYNESTLSILLRVTGSGGTVSGNKISTYFLQYPIDQLRLLVEEITGSNDSLAIVNCYETIDESMLKALEGIDGNLIAVSGLRNVSSLLSDSNKIIRIYEMEVDEDDDEQLEISSQNVSMEN